MIAGAAPDPSRTYISFRRQIHRFVVDLRADSHDERKLRSALNDALKSWHSQGYPKSWLIQAQSDVLKMLAHTRAPA